MEGGGGCRRLWRSELCSSRPQSLSPSPFLSPLPALRFLRVQSIAHVARRTAGASTPAPRAVDADGGRVSHFPSRPGLRSHLSRVDRRDMRAVADRSLPPERTGARLARQRGACLIRTPAETDRLTASGSALAPRDERRESESAALTPCAADRNRAPTSAGNERSRHARRRARAQILSGSCARASGGRRRCTGWARGLGAAGRCAGRRG